MSLGKKAKDYLKRIKNTGKYTSEKHAGKTVNRARMEDRNRKILKQMISQAQQTKKMGMPLTAEQRFLMDYRDIIMN